MSETWYVLENGDVADPREVTRDKDGVWRHKSGVAVAKRGDVLRSRSVDPDEVKKPKPAKSRDMKAKSGLKYETR